VTVPKESKTQNQGPVIRRRSDRQPTTTDQRLLSGKGSSDWVHTDPWRVLRIQAEFVEGFGTLAELGPAVSVFGSARTKRTNPMYEAAETIGRRLAEEGIVVMTGGGPGIMEAANRGARDAGALTIGFNIQLPHEQHGNPYCDISLTFKHFYARKVMFVKAAEGFVIFPGGFGTLDELFESLTLIQTGKIGSFPVVLFDTAYWGPMLDWIRSRVLEEGLVSASDLELLMCTDESAEALDFVVSRFDARVAEGSA